MTYVSRITASDETRRVSLRLLVGTTEVATLLIGVIILLIWGSESTDSAETPEAAPPASA